MQRFFHERRSRVLPLRRPRRLRQPPPSWSPQVNEVLADADHRPARRARHDHRRRRRRRPRPAPPRRPRRPPRAPPTTTAPRRPTPPPTPPRAARERPRRPVRDRRGAARGGRCAQGGATARHRAGADRGRAAVPRVLLRPVPRCASAARSRRSSASARCSSAVRCFAALVAVSYLAFAGFVIVALRSGAPISSCGCFGKVDTPPSVVHVVLDVAFAGVAVGGRVRRRRRAARRARRPAAARDSVPAAPRDRMLARVPRVHLAPEDDGRRPGGRRVSCTAGREQGRRVHQLVGAARPPALLERKSSRRGFLIGSAMVGSAVAVAGCAPGTQPGDAVQPHHRLRAAGSAPTGGPSSAAPSTTGSTRARPAASPAAGGAPTSPRFCNGTRYYIDCMQNCCGPNLGNGFCAGCTECRCGGGCDTRRIYCNYFRYGQCHQEIGISGPIACRRRHLHAAVHRRVDGVQHRGRGRQPHRRARARARVHAPTPTVRLARRPPLHRRRVELRRGEGRLLRPPSGRQRHLRRVQRHAGVSSIPLGQSVDSGLTAAQDPSGSYVFGRGTGNEQIWYQRNDRRRLVGLAVAGRQLRVRSVGRQQPVRALRVRARWRRRGLGPNARPRAASAASSRSGARPPPTRSAVSDPSGVYVFVTGKDSGVYYRRFSGGGWSAWTALGGAATSDCWAVSDPSRALRLRPRHRQGPRLPAVLRRRLVGVDVARWRGDLRSVRDQPVVRARTSSCAGNDNAVWTQRLAGGTWSGWTSLGGGADAGPVAAGDDAAGLFLFVRANDNALWFRRLVGQQLVGLGVARRDVRAGARRSLSACAGGYPPRARRCWSWPCSRPVSHHAAAGRTGRQRRARAGARQRGRGRGDVGGRRRPGRGPDPERRHERAARIDLVTATVDHAPTGGSVTRARSVEVVPAGRGAGRARTGVGAVPAQRGSARRHRHGQGAEHAGEGGAGVAGARGQRSRALGAADRAGGADARRDADERHHELDGARRRGSR